LDNEHKKLIISKKSRAEGFYSRFQAFNVKGSLILVVEYKYRKSMDPFVRFSVPTVYGNTPTFLGAPLAKSKGDLKGADMAIIGGGMTDFGENPWRTDIGMKFSATAHLAPFYAPIYNPKRLRQASLKYGGYLPELDIDVFEHIKLVDYGDITGISPAVTEEDEARKLKRTVEKVGEVLDAGCIPVIIESNPYHVAKAVADRTKGKVGIIFLDAHGDNACPPPFQGWVDPTAELKNVDMTNFVQIGVRGPRMFKEQMEWYRKKGSHVYTYREIKKMGMEAVAEEAIRIAHDGTDSVYLNIDYDVLDIGVAPGLDEPLGISIDELLTLSLEIGKSGFTAFNIENIMSQMAPIYHIITFNILYLLAGIAMKRTGIRK
jgi:guanidinopropionase